MKLAWKPYHHMELTKSVSCKNFLSTSLGPDKHIISTLAANIELKCVKAWKLYFQKNNLTPTYVTAFISDVFLIVLLQVISFLRVLKASESFVEKFFREKV